MRRILLVEDERAVAISIQNILEDEDFEVCWAASAEEGLKKIDEGFDLLLTDVWLPQMDGLTLISEIIKKENHPPVIVMSGHGTIETAVKATKLGAFDFLEKPLSSDKLLLSVNNCLRQHQIAEILESETDVDRFVGNSNFSKTILNTLKRIANSDAPVLVTGENGCGKNMIAHLIHRFSQRKNFPLVSVNCAAIPETLIESELFGYVKGAFTGASTNKKGKFELADSSTLFLDEIGDMDASTQAKILKVLEEQEMTRLGAEKSTKVNVRIVAATNRDLQDLIKKGLFREDLFYRLNVIPIRVPPLRERKEDIPELAERFLAETCSKENRLPMKFDEKVIAQFKKYSWPGNIRELKNMIYRMCILTSSQTITLESLPSEILKAEEKPSLQKKDLRSARIDFEKSFLLQVLEENGFNISKTAGEVGLDRTALHRKIKQLGIDLKQSPDV